MLTLVVLSALLVEAAMAVTCGFDKPLSLCCMAVSPWFSNSGIWGGVCGYTPSNPNELIGGRCGRASGTCPMGTTATCCSSFVPGPSGQCALGTNCGTPTIPPPPPIVPAPVPSGWTVASSCATDSGSRVITSDVITLLGDNTPATCIAHCALAGYTFAGVEYGSECHCGTGFQPGTPDDIDPARCSVRCSGNSSYTCGGSWATQLYTGPAVEETLPQGWTELVPCAEDTSERVFADEVVTVLENNTPATCVELCVGLGATYAGVEYGDECHCASAFAGGVVPDAVSASQCGMPCAGDNGLTCGGSWRIQIYAANA